MRGEPDPGSRSRQSFPARESSGGVAGGGSGGEVCATTTVIGDRGLGVVHSSAMLGCGEWNTPPPAFCRDRTRGLGRCGQASKGVWGMSWRREAQGRDRLRKARGSRQAGSDPGVPELTARIDERGKGAVFARYGSAVTGHSQVLTITPLHSLLPTPCRRFCAAAARELSNQTG
jgi:hypothetical protein